VKDLDMASDSLVVMVQRNGDEVIVPLGDTQLHAGDKVILLQVEEGEPVKRGLKRLFRRR